MQNNTSKCFEGNNCFTFLSKRQLIDEGHLLAIGVVSLSMIPFAVLANTALLIHFTQNRTVPNNFRTLLKILAVSDLLVGVITLPLFSVILMFHAGTCDCELELVCQFIAAFLAGTSGRTTGMIAVDRYIHIKYSNIYPLVLTPKYKAVMYSLSIIVSFFVALSTTLGTLFGQYPLICGIMTVVDIAVLGSVVFLYLNAWRTVNRHVRTSVVWSTVSRRPKINLILAKKVTGILVVLSICYGPFVTTNFLRSFFDAYFQGSTLTQLNLWSYNLLFANSVLNALVLLRKNRQLRKSTPFSQQAQVLAVMPRHSSKDRKISEQKYSGAAMRKTSEIMQRRVGFSESGSRIRPVELAAVERVSTKF